MIGSSLLMASFGFMVHSVSPAMADDNNQKFNVNSNYKLAPTNADGSINVKLSDEQIKELAKNFSSEVVDVAIVGYRARPGALISVSYEHHKFQFNQLYLQTVEKGNHLPPIYANQCEIN